MLQEWISHRNSFLLHTTTATAITATSAITPNVTPSPIDKLPVSEAAVWIFCTALAGSAVVEAVKIAILMLIYYVIIMGRF